MRVLKTGEFFGETNETIQLSGLTITDTEYTLDKVDWHYHENAYFTFILAGNVQEKSRKHDHICSPGSLLFHNWQDTHCNIKPPGYTRGFQIELSTEWFNSVFADKMVSSGSMIIHNPLMKKLMYNVFRESKLSGKQGQLSIDSLLTELVAGISASEKSNPERKPLWVKKLRDLLHSSTTDRTLSSLAAEINLHPVYLSRSFPKYFKCSLGDYIRTIKIQRALKLFAEKEMSMTQIAFSCGFADQSHFIRSFRSVHSITPLHYQRILLKR